MERNTAAEQLWTWKFFLLILINFGNGLAGYMTVPLVTKYAMSIGADITTASSVSSVLSLVAMFMCPVAGVLSDRINRKKLLLVTEIAYSICLFSHVFVANLVMLFVMRAITGIFFAISNVLTVAYASNYIPHNKMGEGLGYFGLVTPLVQAAAPSIGLGLRDSVGYGAAFIGAAIAAGIALICVVVLPYEDICHSNEKRSLHFRDIFAIEFLGLMLLTAVFSSANGLVSTYLDILAGERSIANISMFFTVYSIALIISKPLTGKLLDVKGVYFVLIPAVIFAAAGMFFIGTATSLGVMLVAAVCKALGQGAGTPTIQAHAVKQLDKSKSGVAVSTVQIGQSLGNSIAPVLGSFFVEPFGYKIMFCGVSGIVVFAGMILLLLQYGKEKKIRV